MLADFVTLLGADHVIRASAAQDVYPCTSRLKRNIIGVVRPSSVEDVQEIVRLAHLRGISLYPLSTGKNWGYGAGIPDAENALIVDLGRMNSILDFDPALGLVTLQPGVTQQQLYRYITDHDLPFYTPVTGSSPWCSLIGNALERGYGVTPITDHFAGITSIKAVLADGSLFQGLLSEMNARASDVVSKWGGGPYLDGLFSQGNFGIVTEATIALSRTTEKNIFLLYEPKDGASLEDMVDVSRNLQQQYKGIVSSVKFFNRAFNASMTGPYPRELLSDPAFDINVWLADRGQRFGIPEWTGGLFIYGNKKLATLAKKECKKALAPHCRKIITLDETGAAVLKRIGAVIPKLSIFKPLTEKIDTACALLDFSQGKPQERFLRTAYWRAGDLPPPGVAHDPGKQNSGILWFAPILPFEGNAILEAERLAQEVCGSYGFPTVISITTISGQGLTALFPVMFDPSTEIDRAHDCHRALFGAFKARGFLPYRAHKNAMGWYADPQESVYWQTVRKSKSVTDPMSVISPGRYDGSYQSAKNG